MDSLLSFELVGYMASVFVAVSLMMRSVTKLRVINLVGAVLFTVYGLIIAAYPVAVVNGFIVLVNIYYLQQMHKETAVRLQEVSA
ncbi:MAG: YgjV family protein [Anaerolineales bacterium]|nr:YgjV family protein [Anaerolineales bacterium]